MTTAQDNAALLAAVLNVSNTWKYMITERESNTSVGNEATSVRREAKTLSSSCCQFKEIDAKVMNCSSSSNNNNNNNNNRDSGHSKSKKRSKYVANKRLKRPRKKPSPDSSSVETKTTLTSSDQNVSLLGAAGSGSSGESVLDKESEEGSGASVEYARSGDSDEDTGGISGFDFETGGEEDSEHQTEGDEVVDSLDGNFYAKDFIGKEEKGDTEKEHDSKTDVIADDYGKMTDAESKTWKEKDMKTESEDTKSGSEEEEGKVTKNDSEGTKSGSEEEEGKDTKNDSEGTKSGSEEEEGKDTKNESEGTKSGSEEEEGKVTKNESEGTKSGSEEEEGKDTKNDSEYTESESQEEGKDMKNDSKDTKIGSEEGWRPKLEKLNEKEPGIEDKSEFSEEDETHERKFEESAAFTPRKPTTPRKEFAPESKSFGYQTTESKHLDNTEPSNEHYRNSVESKDTTTENEQVEVSATVISSEESTASDDPYVQPITDSEPNEGVGRSEMFFSEMASTARDTTRSIEKTGPTMQSEPIFMETPEVSSSPEIESHAENSTDIKPLDSIFGKPQPRSESYEEDYSMSESELTEVPTSESESDSVESVLVCEPSEEPTAMSMQHTKQLEIEGIEESGTEREKMENGGAKRELHKNRVRISRPVQLPIQESESHPQSETDDFEDESHVELSERYRTDLNDEDDVVDVGDRAGLDYGGGTIVDTGGADFDVTRGRQCSEHP